MYDLVKPAVVKADNLLAEFLDHINEASVADAFPRELLLILEDHLKDSSGGLDGTTAELLRNARNLDPTCGEKPCDPGCPGWAVFTTGYGEYIQRCDDCGRFESDEAAATHAGDLLAHTRHTACEDARVLLAKAELLATAEPLARAGHR